MTDSSGFTWIGPTRNDHVPTRIRLAWNVLRGRPTAYRIRTRGINVEHQRGVMVRECDITGSFEHAVYLVGNTGCDVRGNTIRRTEAATVDALIGTEAGPLNGGQ